MNEPRYSLEAEMMLLGAILCDFAALDEVVDLVPSGAYFYAANHQTIYNAMLRLAETSEAPDTVQLISAMSPADRDAVSETINTSVFEYLGKLQQRAGSSQIAYAHAKTVAAAYRLREIDMLGQRMQHGAANRSPLNESSVAAVADDAMAALFTLTERSDRDTTRDVATLAKARIDAMDRNEPPRGVPSGFHELDTLIPRFRPGEVIILAARPSMGKTALSTCIAMNVADATSETVAIFSLEMSGAALTDRMLAMDSGVEFSRIQDNQAEGDEYRKVLGALDSVSKRRIVIDDNGGATVTGIRAKARRLAKRSTLVLVVIDYLQLINTTGRRENRNVEVSDLSRAIKAMASELQVPVVCLSQLNRAVESRSDNRPRMSDLRDSGSIEQDADVVLLLHREDYYHAGDMAWLDTNRDKIGMAEVIVAKQRNGPTGVAKLKWNAPRGRFEHLAEVANGW